MTAKPRVVLIALDACDPRTAQDLARAGRMPVLRDILRRGARSAVRNPPGLFVGGLWPSFATGLRPDRHRLHCWDEIDVASYERRLTSPRQRQGRSFWRRLGAAGRQYAVIDVPHTVVEPAHGGVEIAEWGCHDRHLGFQSWPAGEAQGLEREFGLHPVLGLDAHSERSFAPDDYIHRSGPVRTPEEEASLLEGLLAGLEIKGRLSARVLAASSWDLFITVFGESHAVGHQQWHLHDRGHPRFDASVAAVTGNPIERVYVGLDGELGRLTAATAGCDLLLVLLSHGMGPHHDGAHLLDEVLQRIDLADRTAADGGRWGSAWRRGFQALPVPFQALAQRPAAPALRHRAQAHRLEPCREFISAAERARQRFFVEPNNYVYGGVRLNLAGREPQGLVCPAAADATLEGVARDLRALVNVATGNRVVREAERADRWYRRCEDDRIPDLFLDWERTAPIETVWSAKTGFVHAPYVNWRTGDHRPEGLLLALGTGIPPGRAMPAFAIEDLPASLMARLGTDPADMDGRPVPWLAS